MLEREIFVAVKAEGIVSAREQAILRMQGENWRDVGVIGEPEQIDKDTWKVRVSGTVSSDMYRDREVGPQRETPYPILGSERQR
jgi:hypothetical protein